MPDITENPIDAATAAKAELALPAATFAEGDGTFVNSEGRAQRFIQVYAPEGEIRESWRWLRAMRIAAGHAAASEWENLDLVLASLEAALPAFQGIRACAPPPSFRVEGLRIPRQPHRFSGRTAMRANVNVSEGKIAEDPDSPLTFSMEGYRGMPPASLIPAFWAPGWNSVQSVTRFQEEISGSLKGGDPGVRLIEAATACAVVFFRGVPSAFQAHPGEYLAIPLFHIFGSEELSALAPAVAERAPQPYVALNPADAALLGVPSGGKVAVHAGNAVWRAAVLLRPELPAGTAGVSAGLTDAEFLNLPGWATVKKDTTS